jgi:hypothetical protein
MLFALISAAYAFVPSAPVVPQQAVQYQPTVQYGGLRGTPTMMVSTVPVTESSRAWPSWMLLALGLGAAAPVAALWTQGRSGGYGGYGGGYGNDYYSEPYRSDYGGMGGYGRMGGMGGYGRMGGMGYGMGNGDYGYGRGYDRGYGGNGMGSMRNMRFDVDGPHGYGGSSGDYLASPDYGYLAAQNQADREHSVASHRTRGGPAYMDYVEGYSTRGGVGGYGDNGYGRGRMGGGMMGYDGYGGGYGMNRGLRELPGAY